MILAGIQRVHLVTDLGSLLLEVYAQRAPQSAGAFLRYVREGRYQGASFLRTVRSDNDHGTPTVELIQAAVSGEADAQLTVEHESTAVTGITHLTGTVALARTKPGTGTPAHFFICLGDQPAMDCGGARSPDGLGFAAFGRVIDGMETARRIHRQPTLLCASEPYLKGQLIAEPVKIRSAWAEPFSECKDVMEVPLSPDAGSRKLTAVFRKS